MNDILNKITHGLATIDKKVIKSNLRLMLKELYPIHNGREGICKLTGITSGVLNAMINQAHPASVVMNHLINLITTLNLDINEIFADNKIILDEQGRHSNGEHQGKWTHEAKKKFVDDYCIEGIDFICNRYNIKARTAMSYYDKFRTDIWKGHHPNGNGNR